MKSFLLIFALYSVTSISGVDIPEVEADQDILSYIDQYKGEFNQVLFNQIVGAANEYKEGDDTLGVAASNDQSRQNARKLLSNTKLQSFHDHPLYEDNLQKFIWENVDQEQFQKVKNWKMGELKSFLMSAPEAEIKEVSKGLNSHIIGSVVKLMTNEELGDLSKKVFITQPGGQIGGKGYFGARVQPNSPTDDPDDIEWQVYNAFAFAVGDVMLGTNPVDSTVESVALVQKKLKDIIQTFEQKYDIQDLLPWVVLSHIDVQAKVEKKYPGLTTFWFQSIAGTDSANKTFDLDLEKLVNYAKERKGKYAFYFETGQGADFTNGHGKGFDMVNHEANKYALARILNEIAAKNNPESTPPFSVVNDVAGFIGPEVYKTWQQLVRTTLEDIVMGKLSGLTIGLDICSTLHMDVSLDDLEKAQNEIMRLSNPGYAMALPTRNDPMLSYLTTSFQDHVRIREKTGLKVNDKMWDFFKKLGVIDQEGIPTQHFGDPRWVYYQFLKAKGDTREQEEVYVEALEKITQVETRGVSLALGFGETYSDLNPALEKRMRAQYDDAKFSIWVELKPDFVQTIPSTLNLKTQAKDRKEYIYSPPTGEVLDEPSQKRVQELAKSREQNPDVQFVISDGLNAQAIMDENHLMPFVDSLKGKLEEQGLSIAPENLILTGGRVRAGYQIGQLLFGDDPTETPRTLVHIIGERPGSGHHNFSAYLVSPPGRVWKRTGKNKVDHDIAKLVSGISDTALNPVDAADETIFLINQLRTREYPEL